MTETQSEIQADRAVETYAARFEALRAALPGAEAGWLDGLRARALAAFRARGFPTQKREAWKYTGLKTLRQAELYPAPAGAPAAIDRVPALLPQDAAFRAVFVDGAFRPELSQLDGLPAGVELSPLPKALAAPDDALREALEMDDAVLAELPFLALNTAFMADGLVLRLAPGTVLERPLALVSLNTGGNARHLRHLVLAGANSEATLLEHHVGHAGPYLSNSVTQVHAGDGARLRRCRVLGEAADAFHFGLLDAVLERNARLENFELLAGAGLSRNESRVRLAGPGAELRLDGSYLMAGRQHCDITTWIDHAAGDTTSQETYKGVLDDQARAAFQGRITVRPQAQRISGHQLSKALLLSRKAEIDTKPELEIFADDVKCSHGATAGELDETALFYLRSRGIPCEEARGLLIEAFLAEVWDGISHQALREAVAGEAAAWFEGHGVRRAA